MVNIDDYTETLARLVQQVRESGARGSWGPHCLAVPEDIRSTTIHEEWQREGYAHSGVCRTLSEKEYCFVLEQAFGTTFWDDWYSVGRRSVRDDLTPNPDRLLPDLECPLPVEERTVSDVDLWMRRGWQLCSWCKTTQPEFNLVLRKNGKTTQQVSGGGGQTACDHCIVSYRFQTRDSIGPYLEKLYCEWAKAAPKSPTYETAANCALGEHDGQLSTFNHYGLEACVIRELFGNRCAYCGVECQGANNFDHAVPRAEGGHDVPENIIWSCGSCNSSKRVKSVADFYAYRRKKNRFVPEDLEEVARDIERRYHDVYDQFTTEDVLRIKEPLLKLFPLAKQGEEYYHYNLSFEQRWGSRGEFPPGTLVRVVSSGRGVCLVETNSDGKQFWADTRSLRQPTLPGSR